MNLYKNIKSNLKESSRDAYYIGPNEYAMVKSNDEDSDVLCMYLDDNCYDKTVIPKNWPEEKIRKLAGKISKQEGPRGDRDFVKEVEDEVKELNESYEEDTESIVKQAAEYLFNDVDGDWDARLPEYEEFTDTYMEINKRLFNRAVKLAEEALGNFAEHHYFDRDYNKISKSGALLELNDNHTMWELNNPTLTNDEQAWMLWDDIVTSRAKEFEDETGVEIYGCGRSGRHMCVEPTFENCLNFNKLQETQEALEDAAIDEFNNYKEEE